MTREIKERLERMRMTRDTLGVMHYAWSDKDKNHYPPVLRKAIASLAQAEESFDAAISHYLMLETANNEKFSQKKP